MEEYEQNEGVKNLRDALKKRDEELEALRADLTKRDERDAAEAATRRGAALADTFKTLGLSDRAVSLYPADADTSPDAIAEWASTHGLNAQKAPEVDPNIEGLNRLSGGSFSTPSPDDDLNNKILKGVTSARDRKTVPTQAEKEEHQDHIDRINATNRRLEREVLSGRAAASTEWVGGRGGLIDPPKWANRTIDAQNDL